VDENIVLYLAISVLVSRLAVLSAKTKHLVE